MGPDMRVGPAPVDVASARRAIENLAHTDPARAAALTEELQAHPEQAARILADVSRYQKLTLTHGGITGLARFRTTAPSLGIESLTPKEELCVNALVDALKGYRGHGDRGLVFKTSERPILEVA